MRPARLACVHLRALAQEVAYRHGWLVAGAPAALRAGRQVIWACPRAAAAGVAAGMGVAQARSLCPPLALAAAPATALAAAAARAAGRLASLSPHVELDDAAPALCWLDAGGMEALFGSTATWAENVERALAEMGHRATVVVGHNRLFLAALATAQARLWVAPCAAGEARRAAALPAAALPASPALAARLADLGLRTVADFMRLSAAACGQYLGAEAAHLHRRAHAPAAAALAPRRPPAPIVQTVALEPPTDDAHRLMFALMPALRGGLEAVARRAHRATGLLLRLRDEAGGERPEVLRPARPGCEARAWLELVRLRLAAMEWRRPVAEVVLVWSTAAAAAEQLPLWRAARRDPDALAAAVARLRALMGEASVVRAELCDSHRPEQRYRYQPWRDGPPAVAGPPTAGGLVRQLFARPRPLAAAQVQQARRHLRAGVAAPPPRECRRPRPVGEGRAPVWGPYRSDVAWWLADGGGLHHDDYYLTVPAGDGAWLVWAAYDRRRRRWLQRGWVR